MKRESTNISGQFLSGGGEMGALTRSKDWSKTSLGDIETWPQSLLTTISILLSSKFPMFLWWGPDLIQFYNDSYRPSLGNDGKHPTALGQKAVDCWPEIWAVIKPLIDQVLGGGDSVWSEDQLIPIYRNGKLEDVYWTFSYSPVRDESGEINGVLVVCNETTEKILNLKKIEASEIKFRNTIKQAPVAVSILRGPHHVIEIANDKILELWGKTDQVIGKKLFEGVHEAANQGFEEILRNVYTTGKRYVGNDASVRLARPGGIQNFFVNFIYEPIYENDGSITGITVVAIDVTTQVEARNALVQSENRIRTLIAKSPVAMTILKGQDFVIEIANETLLKNLWRKEFHEVQNKKLIEVFPELKDQKFPQLLNSVFKTGKAEKEIEARAYVDSHDGRKEFYLDFEFSPFYEIDGEISGVFITVNDVTERVEAREKINEAAERLSLATEGTQLATWDLNLVSRSLIYTSWLPIIFGHDASKKLSQKEFRDQIHPEDSALVNEAHKKALTSGILYYEARIVLPNKTIRWIRAQGKVVFDENHVPTRMLGTLIDITEHQEIEQKISRLASIVESSDDAIISRTLDGVISSWNDSAQRIFGYTPEEMIGQSISKIIPSDRLNEEHDIISRLRNGERVDHFQTKRITKNKNILDISLTISPIRDANGNVVGSSKIARDITTQKQAEKLLNESRQHLQIVVEASELGTWELSLPNREFTYSNRYIEILGHKGINPTHADLTKLLHPDDVEIREEAFKIAFATGVLYYTTRIIRPDKTIRWVEAKGKVFYNEKNEPFKMIGTIRDITAERTYRQVLEESEQKFRLLADSMPQFVWIGNEAGTLHYFNQSVYQYTGLTTVQIERDGWLQIVHPDDREENIKLWTHSVKTGEPFLFEHRFKRFNGVFRWQLSRAVPQKDKDGKIQMWVGTSTDIHDRKIFTDELENEVQLRTKELKQSNEDLIKSNSELAQFAYVASHDLQEPLRKIQTFSTRLLESESENLSDKGKDYFNRMQLASKRMQQLILDLLSYSRANTTEKHFEIINLSSLLLVVKEQLKETIEQKSAIIHSTALPTLSVIPYQFEQLLTNIIANALKFSKVNEAPVIEIKADIVENRLIEGQSTITGTYHRISITDNGIGFDPQFSERIFQVFQRLHGKDEFPGTGIGLAIVKKIVENHNGIIIATGELNKGATFTIYLPIY